MIASEILAKGVEQGIISAEQAERLRALEDVREPPELPASPDDEQLRFIGGFSDIFARGEEDIFGGFIVADDATPGAVPVSRDLPFSQEISHTRRWTVGVDARPEVHALTL